LFVFLLEFEPVNLAFTRYAKVAYRVPGLTTGSPISFASRFFTMTFSRTHLGSWERNSICEQSESLFVGNKSVCSQSESHWAEATPFARKAGQCPIKARCLERKAKRFVSEPSRPARKARRFDRRARSYASEPNRFASKARRLKRKAVRREHEASRFEAQVRDFSGINMRTGKSETLLIVI